MIVVTQLCPALVSQQVYMNYTDNNVMLFKKNIYLEVKELFFSNIFKLKQ